MLGDILLSEAIEVVNRHAVQIERPSGWRQKFTTSEQRLQVSERVCIFSDLARAKLHSLKVQRLHLIDVSKHPLQACGAAPQAQLVASQTLQSILEEVLELRKRGSIRREAQVELIGEGDPPVTLSLFFIIDFRRQLADGFGLAVGGARLQQTLKRVI